MKTNMAPAGAILLLLVLALSGTSEAVRVQAEGRSFSLDDVRTLQALTKTFGEAGNPSPRMRASPGFVCANPRLPSALIDLLAWMTREEEEEENEEEERVVNK
ncbi:hypothetical protein CRUP_036814 [Coryphaenoides rupestris]|nr:hypothetical protein CRUP_036814 [Coryphaenoides rupestris]